jgi:cation diffusion facilitator family transporter
MSAAGTTRVVVLALACNLGIAISKFAAALFTGSSAMLSGAIHSLIDSSHQGLLYHGLQRSQRPPDAGHPSGYSKELYFWSFVVAVLLFSLGAGVSIYEGIDKVLRPQPILSPGVNYLVLSAALVLVGISTGQAMNSYSQANAGNQTKTGEISTSALQRSKNPALFTVLLENVAAIAGLVVAMIGILLTDLGGIAIADGFASIMIGLIMAAVAAFMALEIKRLLVDVPTADGVASEGRSLDDVGMASAKPTATAIPTVTPEAPASAPMKIPPQSLGRPPESKKKKGSNKHR